MSGKIKSFLGVLSTFQISLFTLFKGKKVGSDMYGNIYYEGRPRPGTKRPRRWVIYKAAPEASSVPPEFHGWLHHQTDIFPKDGQSEFRQKWQKPHRANMTGTAEAYVPQGHASTAQPRAAATGDYRPWTPPE